MHAQHPAQHAAQRALGSGLQISQLQLEGRGTSYEGKWCRLIISGLSSRPVLLQFLHLL